MRQFIEPLAVHDLKKCSSDCVLINFFLYSICPYVDVFCFKNRFLKGDGNSNNDNCI